jgi:hypothetical protein
MKSPRRHRSRWSHVNTPDGLRRRKAKIDARREALAATLPPVYAGPEPLSLWQSVQVLDGAGRVLHSIALHVPTAGRCDQHAAVVDGVRCDRMLTATDVGRMVSGMVRKRPSVSMLAEWRSDLTPCMTTDAPDVP